MNLRQVLPVAGVLALAAAWSSSSLGVVFREYAPTMREEGLELPQSLTLQALVAAAERLGRRQPTKHGGPAPLDVVEEARDRLAQPRLRVDAIPCFEREHGGKRRWLANPKPVERLLCEALLPWLERAVERRAHDGAHAFRRGRSTYTAAAALQRCLADGATLLVFADIQDFFGSIDRDRLVSELSNDLPESILETIAALVAAPLLQNGSLLHPDSGIALGLPISPALSNLYLEPVDRRFESLPAGYVRYADDIALAGSRTDAEQALGVLREAVVERGLALNDSKLRMVHVEGPVTYLGHIVSAQGVFGQVSSDRLQPHDPELRGVVPDDNQAAAVGVLNRRRQTLYVTKPRSYLRTRAGKIEVVRNKEVTHEIPFHRVDRVVVLAALRTRAASSRRVSGTRSLCCSC